MLLSPHILVGAAVAASAPNLAIGLVLAFLSHLLLDKIPHWEYSVEPLKQIKTKGYKRCLPILRRVAADFAVGYLILIIAVLISGKDIPFAAWAFGGFFGALPDGLSFLLFIKKDDKGYFGVMLKMFYILHQRLHFDKKNNPPLRMGLATQAVASLLALYFLIF